MCQTKQQMQAIEQKERVMINGIHYIKQTFAAADLLLSLSSSAHDWAVNNANRPNVAQT